MRLLRVGENIRHALSTILQRESLQDPALSGVSVTVAEVRVSPDLRNATIFVLPLGGDNQAAVVDALQRAAPYLRSRLGGAVRLKYLPQLNFQLDHSFDRASHLDELLADPHVQQDLGKDLGQDLDQDGAGRGEAGRDEAEEA